MSILPQNELQIVRTTIDDIVKLKPNDYWPI